MKKTYKQEVHSVSDQISFKEMKGDDKFNVSTIALSLYQLRNALAKKEDAVFFPKKNLYESEDFDSILEEYKDYVSIYRFKPRIFDLHFSKSAYQKYKCNAYFFKFQNEEYYNNLKFGAKAENLETILFNLRNDEGEQNLEISRISDIKIINIAKKMIDENKESLIKMGDFIVSDEDKVLLTIKDGDYKELFIKTNNDYLLVEMKGNKIKNVYETRPTRMNYNFHIWHKDEVTQIDAYYLWYRQDTFNAFLW